MNTLVLLATERSVEALKRGLKILVLGGVDTNFSNELREDERFVFWHSTDPDTRRPRPVPRSVGLALLTRFIDHKVTDRIKEQVICLGPIPNGQIGTLLTDAIAELEEEQEPAVDATPEMAARVNYSELPDFLVDQIASDKLGVDLLEDDTGLARLQTLANERWPDVTRQRVTRALRRGLYHLGLFDEMDENTPSTDVESSEPEVTSEDQVRKLTDKLKKLEAEVVRLQKERKGLNHILNKKDVTLGQSKRDFYMLALSMVSLIDKLTEQCGLQLVIPPKIAELLLDTITRGEP